MRTELDIQVRATLHGIVPDTIWKLDDYSPEALERSMDLNTLAQKYIAAEKGLRSHCHGMVYISMLHLARTGVLQPEDTRARFVLTGDYDYHMPMEYRKGNLWRMLDPGKPERDFKPSPDIIRSYEAMRKINPEKLKDITPELKAMSVMTQDTIAVVDGPFQPWRNGYVYMIGNEQLTRGNAVELYRAIGSEMESVLRRGEPEEMRLFKETHGIGLG